MQQALIIIDMQQGSFTAASPRHDAAGLVRRLNRLSGAVRAAGGSVLFVQHDGPEGDAHHPDAPGWHLLPDLVVRDGDAILRKSACDAFLGTCLEAKLTALGIGPGQGRVIVTGCATDYCVDTTVRSALARGIPTTVPADGHTTADRPHLPAVRIIEHHNAIWADFLAPGGPARLCRCDEAVAG